MLFINLDFSDKAKKLICTVGPLTFGVYIISDNPIVRVCIISKVPQFIDRNSGNLMVIWIILFAAAVFISCLLIEFAVQLLFGKIGVRRMCDKICLLLANLFKNTAYI